VRPRLRTGLIAGASLALFALGIGVFVLPFAYPTPPPIVTRYTATRAFSNSSHAGDGHRSVARISVRLRQPSTVTLTVRGAGGKVERVLLQDAERPRGWVRASWAGRDEQGNPVPPGSYALDLRVHSGRKRWNSSRKVVVDPVAPGLGALEVRSAALSGTAGAQCRLSVTAHDDGVLVLEALRDGTVVRKVGRRPVKGGETVRWAWGGLSAGMPVTPGLLVLRATIRDPSGNALVREQSCWLGQMVGRTVPRVPRAGDLIQVRLTLPDGTPLDPRAAVGLALYRRVATPGRSLKQPLGARVARAARGPAGTVALRLPRTIRPSALWLVATSGDRRALIPLGIR
jgi:hypothetical protein